MPLRPQISPTPLLMPGKRGESRESTLTESSYPTDKPPTSYYHGVPTIGGSMGGFVGLVVGLALLALITSLAAFILIRRRRRTQAGDSFQGFPKSRLGMFKRRKAKGWMRTQSYTDHDDIHLSPKAGHSTAYNDSASADAPNAGRVYDDPFNAASLDNLQRETSARIDHGPEYHPVATIADPDLHPPSTLPAPPTEGSKV